MIEQTLVLIKPDGIQRGLIGDILKRFEQRGLKIVGMKMVKAEESLAGKHYTEDIAEKHGEKIRNALLKFITGSPVIALCIQGSSAITTVRKIVGNTYPGEADIGTIRGDFAHASKKYVQTQHQGHNLIHASENQQDAKEELALWFSIDEIHDYNLSAENHLL